MTSSTKTPKAEKVLIVDDERPIRKLLKKIIDAQGYTIFTAENISMAMQLLKEHPIDIVLTDLNMPGGSGLELIEHIKKHYKSIGIIVGTVITDPVMAQQVVEAGVYGYLVKPFDKNQVIITLENAIRSNYLEQERVIAKEALESRFKTILDTVEAGLMLVDEHKRIIEVNQQMHHWFDFPSIGFFDLTLGRHHFVKTIYEQISVLIDKVLLLAVPEQEHKRLQTVEGEKDYQVSVFPVIGKKSKADGAVVMLVDMTKRIALENELHQAQKLEAIGQLTAGVAHEINTPIQYIGDNLNFLTESFQEIDSVLQKVQNMQTTAPQNHSQENSANQLGEIFKTADLDYLLEEIPTTLTQCLEGVNRVSSIVQSMKEFSHPGDDVKVAVDINRCLETTLTISRNEWKYVADTKTIFNNDLPTVLCKQNEINQVFLNLIINAAHAIRARIDGGDDAKGLITIFTDLCNDHVKISIEDNGGGIPVIIQDKIFDPFFTTKEVGKGTGQGLAIAHNIIVDKHGGKLYFETVPASGTTFIVKLPLKQAMEHTTTK